MTIETRPSAAHRIATELAAENKRLRAENSGLTWRKPAPNWETRL